jgi:hypothetical protein
MWRSQEAHRVSERDAERGRHSPLAIGLGGAQAAPKSALARVRLKRRGLPVKNSRVNDRMWGGMWGDFDGAIEFP